MNNIPRFVFIQQKKKFIRLLLAIDITPISGRERWERDKRRKKNPRNIVAKRRDENRKTHDSSSNTNTNAN